MNIHVVFTSIAKKETCGAKDRKVKREPLKDKQIVYVNKIQLQSSFNSLLINFFVQLGVVFIGFDAKYLISSLEPLKVNFEDN